ncbi:MAG: DEAD/DEAH box helicase [Pseudomonadota bacterium]
MNFSDLGLSEKVLSAVTATGFNEPTPIQAEAIPHVLNRNDVLGLAQTGTGKTAAFSLPILTLLERGRARARMPRSLVIAPTRELAAQVAESFETFGANHKYTMALLIGGVSFDEQDKKLMKGADILIATPGRLLDHFERGKLLLTGVEFLVVDEADRMLDMGFMPDLERIFKLVPFTRQTLFFSATMPAEIERFVDTFLQAPKRVEVSRVSSASETIEQKLVKAPSVPAQKRAVLRSQLKGVEADLQNGIVFCNRKRDVSVLERSLKRHGFSVGCLHGDMDQRARLQTLDAFRNNEISLLVASDVAARGLDIPAVSHVFNFDVPTHSEDYVHRIGRTGRAGRTGTAITLATSADQKYVDSIEKLIGTAIPVSEENASDGAATNQGADVTELRRDSDVSSRTSHVESTDDKTKTGERSSSGKRRRDRRGEREPQMPQKPFGETEYVPAFLLRPIRRAVA